MNLDSDRVSTPSSARWLNPANGDYHRASVTALPFGRNPRRLPRRVWHRLARATIIAARDARYALISLVSWCAEMSPDLQGDALSNITFARDSEITVRARACVSSPSRTQRRPFPLLPSLSPPRHPAPPGVASPIAAGGANYKKFPGKFYSRFTHRRRIGDGGVIHRRGLPAARAASPSSSSRPSRRLCGGA